MTIAHNQGGPCLELERSLPNEVAALSPFVVDRLMLLFRKRGCVSEGESKLRSHCAKPPQTRPFTEIMRIRENRSRFVAAVNLRKSQSR